MSDAARVAAFMESWGLEADGIRDDLLDLLREVRAESTQQDTITNGQLSKLSPAVLAEINQRAQVLLAQLAPHGAIVTEELKSRIREELVRVILEALIAAGMNEQHAKLIAAFMSMAIKLKEKA